METPFAGRSFIGTFGLVFLAIALLFTIDSFLAKTEQAESRAEGARLSRQGQALMQQGKNGEAIARFQDALAMERGNRDYLRALAQAQLAAGKIPDAESTLTDFLQSDSTDGLASLLMSRVLVKEGRFAPAISYLHRAIYGDWDRDAAGNRLRARFELIDLLASRNSKVELLAELMAVQDQIPPDLEMKRGRLFLQAGSAAHAADVFRELLLDDPANADAETGLGEAEFARGDYHAAERDYQAALRIAPDHAEARQQLDLTSEVLELDPTIRGLGPAERFRRSLKLLQLTVDDAHQCVGQTPPPDLADLLDRAEAALKARVSPAGQSEAAESNLDVDEQLWQARKKSCRSAPDADSPLALVQARIDQ